MSLYENEQTELKASFVEDIRKEVIAFANTNGGSIYIGVDDNGKVLGLPDADETILQFTNSIRDSIKPDITMFVDTKLIEIEGKKIIKAAIQRGTARPYYIGTKGLKPSGVFIRQGASSVPASEAAIRQMIKENDGDSYEKQRSLIQNLTFEEISRPFAELHVAFEYQQMRTLELINGEGVFTNLALLLSDQCPHMIKAAVFNSTDQTAFQDRREFTGSLYKQLNDAYNYLDLQNKKRATFTGLYRQDSRDIPEEALREALVNAIVHRDYGLSASILLAVYQDRMEITSIGGLPYDISREDILLGLSVCRNVKLANVFYRLRLIEAYGTGLKKIMNSYKESAVKPEIICTAHAFKVVLPKIKVIEKQENMVENQIIIELFTKWQTLNRQEFASALQINSSAAIRLLNKLKDSNLVEVIGQGKNTRYRLKNS